MFIVLRKYNIYIDLISISYKIIYRMLRHELDFSATIVLFRRPKLQSYNFSIISKIDNHTF